MDLSIIIVSWNVRERLRENLKSIYASNLAPFSFEIFVVDNNSHDGTVEMVKKEFPQVRLVANKDNLGFAKANNQAIKYAQGRYILLLNPDMRVFPDTLANMLGWAENHPEVAVAGCRLIDENGGLVPHARRFPEIWDQLAIVLKIPHLFPGLLNSYLRKDFNYTREAEVDSIRGSFFLIKEETIAKIGMLDERFFVWFEEVDYCKRAREAGLKVIYTPAAECVDFVGQGFKQVKRGVAQKLFRASMIKYFQKWHPGWRCALLRFAWIIGGGINIVAGLLKLKGKSKT